MAFWLLLAIIPNYSRLFGEPARWTESPLAFVDMRAVTRGDVAFSSRGNRCAILLKRDGISLRGRAGSIGLTFLGANPNPKIEGVMPQSGHSNYLFGNDPSKWRTNATNYSRVHYGALYPGIHLVYYGNQRQLEYDLVVAPGAEPKTIILQFEGGNRPRLSSKGDLVLSDEVRLLKPRAYQVVDGFQKQIPSRYVLKSRNRVAFAVARYDHSLPLVIDPVLSYATYLGGSSDDEAYAVATDSSGNAYVTGYTASVDFPATSGAYKTANQGGASDVFVAKFSPTGTLVYATYLGGSGDDTAYGIAVDSSNEPYITGSTTSTNFPTTTGAYRTAYRGGASDAFVAKLNAAGNGLVYSTYLGGSGDDIGYAVALDSGNEVTVTGSTSSSDFPTSTGAYRTSNGGGITDAFVTRLNAAGTALVYSTYLGGSGEDVGYGVAVDAVGNAYVTGYTQSTNFPATAGVAQTANAGDYDAFVTALNPSGTVPVYSTLLGGSQQDYGVGIAVDTSGNAYVTGYTASSDYPHTSGVLQPAKRSGYDAIVTKLTSFGTIAYSTFLGGSADDYGLAIAVDSAGNAYITGDTASTDFPKTSNAIQTTATGIFNAFVTRLNATGAALGYSTYVGGSGFETGYGIALDLSGGAYVAGYTVSPDFPVTSGSAQATLAGGSDAFVLKVMSAPSLPLPATKVGTYNAGLWKLDVNGNGTFDSGTDRSFFLGWAGATIVTGDWNGDGRTKVGVYSNGYWFLDYDGNGVWDGGVKDKLVAWGWTGATPIVGDWNGDGKTKIGVYSNGFWFLDYNGDYLWDGGVVDKQVGWGWAGTMPIVGDWNGDGRTKIGVYINGFWFLDYDGNYLWDGGVVDKQVGWGWAGVTPIVGDWNGDGRTKIGVYAGGYWYLDYDGNYLWEYPAKDKIWALGWTGTTPVIGDWNGDGKSKAGAFINGYWYLDYNGNGAWDGSGTDRIYAFGQAGDTPVVGRW